MKHPALILLLAGFFCLIPAAVLASEAVETEPPVEINAEAALLMEVESNTLIWEENSLKKLYPASITKIMSLLIVMELLEEGGVSLQDQVEVSARSSAMGGTELFLSEGDRITLEELITGMAVGSANDAAVAVAEYIAGSEEAFVELMNEKAGRLGMTGTHYCNCHGLHDPDHYTTAKDVALVSCALLKYPLIHRYLTIWMDEHYLKGKIKSGEVYLSNTNRLVNFYLGCDGVKTGFTREAGNCISATAKRGTSRFLAVVLNSPSVEERYEGAEKLLDHGFNHYKSVPVIEEGVPLAELTVNKGNPQKVQVITSQKLNLFMSRGEKEEFTREIILPEEPAAPLEKGQAIGEIIVTYGQGQQVRLELVAAEPVYRCTVLTLFQRLVRDWLKFGR